MTSMWGICQRVTWKKLAGSVFFFAFETLDLRKETGAWKKNKANLPQMLLKVMVVNPMVESVQKSPTKQTKVAT